MTTVYFMKFTLLTVALVTITLPAVAQTTAGNFMVGGNLLSTSVNFQKNNTGFDIALQPKAGYFLNDNLAVGIALEVGLNVLESNLTMNYGITPFARVFVGKSNVNEIPKRVMFFVEAGGGFGGRNSRFKNSDGSKTNVTTNGGIFYVGPGVDIFLSKNVAFELGTEYRYIGGSPNVNRVGLNLGFQIFLSRKEGAAMYKGTKSDG